MVQGVGSRVFGGLDPKPLNLKRPAEASQAQRVEDFNPEAQKHKTSTKK